MILQFKKRQLKRQKVRRNEQKGAEEEDLELGVQEWEGRTKSTELLK